MHHFVCGQVEHKRRVQSWIERKSIPAFGWNPNGLESGSGFHARDDFQPLTIHDSDDSVGFTRDVKRLAQWRKRDRDRLCTDFEIFHSREFSHVDDRDCSVLRVADKCKAIVVSKCDFMLSCAGLDV